MTTAVVPYRGGLAGFCWNPWDHNLKCYSISSAVPKLTEALTQALKSGTVPGKCGAKAAGLLRRVVDADDWDVLPGGEYNWLNQLWRALYHDEVDAPPDCLMGATSGEVFVPGKQWTPPPGDPAPPSEIPWGWIMAGVGVTGIAALYWFVWRKKK